VDTLLNLPHTISFVIRKRQQIDSLNELPKEKRPTEFMVWEGTSDDIERWLDKVFPKDSKKEHQFGNKVIISEDEIEG